MFDLSIESHRRFLLMWKGSLVVVQCEKEASQTRRLCVAKSATLGAARPDPSLRKKRLLGMTIKLHHYRISCASMVAIERLGLTGRLSVSQNLPFSWGFRSV